jgi:endoglycosylceramidase
MTISKNTFSIISISKIILVLLLGTILLIPSCKKDDKDSQTPANKVATLYAKRGNQPGIYDQQGRLIILRGVNYNVLGDYWQGNTTIPAQATYNEEQLKLMASYGFNCIRLIFSWSKLEPKPGQYNQEYIQSINKVIQDAEKYGIYIFLDMHQDAFGKYIFSTKEDACPNPQKGWDGAPDWATITDGASPCSNDGSRENVPAVIHAWENLWNNTNAIQDNLINAWSELIKETGNHQNLIGYNLINEPSLGFSSLQNQQNKLAKFYSNLIQKIRKTETENQQTEKMIFFEPAITSNGQPIPALVGPNFTYDNNIVFAPHHYFEVITQGLLTIEQGYSLYQGLANSYQTACFIGEWGVFDFSDIGISKLKRFAQQEDKYLMSSTFWQWCQAPGDPHGISWDGQSAETSMHLIELDKNANFTGKTNDAYLKVLGRTRPIAIQGKKIKFSSDSENGRFDLSAETSTPGITELWIPNTSGEPIIKGENIKVQELKKVEGGFIAKIEVEATYSIYIE